ncbi:hypothetical protein LguiB_035035 [Lonicera macranthoides]
MENPSWTQIEQSIFKNLLYIYKGIGTPIHRESGVCNFNFSKDYVITMVDDGYLTIFKVELQPHYISVSRRAKNVMQFIKEDRGCIDASKEACPSFSTILVVRNKKETRLIIIYFSSIAYFT